MCDLSIAKMAKRWVTNMVWNISKIDTLPAVLLCDLVSGSRS